MNLLLSKLFILLLAISSAQEYKCPKDAVLIDHFDTIEKQRVVFCQIRKDGKLLKDGAQLTFNAEGRIIKKDFFKDGKSIKGQMDKGVEIPK